MVAQKNKKIGISTEEARSKLKTVVEHQLKCAEHSFETKRFFLLLKDQIWGKGLHVWLNWTWTACAIALYIGNIITKTRITVALVEPSVVVLVVFANMVIQTRKTQHQSTEVHQRFVRIWKTYCTAHKDIGPDQVQNFEVSMKSVLQQGSPLVSIFPAYRNGHWQRLPSLLLVEGDIIALMAGDFAPGRARYLPLLSKQGSTVKWLNNEESVEKGQRITGRIPFQSTPRAPRQLKVDPMSSSLLEHCGDLRCYELEQTPLVELLQESLEPPDLSPPLLYKRIQVVLKLWPWVLMIAVAVTIFGGAVQTALYYRSLGTSQLVSLFLLAPSRVCLLVFPPWVPLAVFLGEALATARLLALASSLFLTWKKIEQQKNKTAVDANTNGFVPLPQVDIAGDDLDVDERQATLSRQKVELRRQLFLQYAKATLRDRLGCPVNPASNPLPQHQPPPLSPSTYAVVVGEDLEEFSPDTTHKCNWFYRWCGCKDSSHRQVDLLFDIPLLRSCFVQRLGAVTMVCVLDEDVVCDPESEPEEIFLLGTEDQGEEKKATTVLDLHTLPDKEGVEVTAFEDPNWWRHLSHLKPIGLACLMTEAGGGNAQPQGSFGISQPMLPNQSATSVKHLEGSQLVYRDLVHHIRHHIPQGFLLDVAQAIGFSKRDTEWLSVRRQLQVLAPRLADIRLTKDLHAQGQHETRHRGLLTPHMRSVVVEDDQRRTMQLMGQGNPALVVAMCKEYWDGEAIAPLRQATRTAILDMFQQWSLEDLEVIALCYTPVPYTLQSYLDHSNRRCTKGLLNQVLPEYFIEDQMCYESALRALNPAKLPSATPISTQTQAQEKTRSIHKVETVMRLEFDFSSHEESLEDGDASYVSGQMSGEEDNRMMTVSEFESPTSSQAGDEKKLNVAELAPMNQLSSLHSSRIQANEDFFSEMETKSKSTHTLPAVSSEPRIRFEAPRSCQSQPKGVDTTMRSLDESEMKVETTKLAGVGTISRTPSTFGIGGMASLQEHNTIISNPDYPMDGSGNNRTRGRLGRVPKAALGPSRSQTTNRVPARRLSLDDSGLDTASGVMTDGRADVAFWNLLREQVFLGMVASSVPPKKDVPSLVEDLDAAGIRFVYFSPRNMRRSKLLVEKMGIETDWNCAISLRPLDEPHTPDPHRMKGQSDWDVNARLPHGIKAIREHLDKVDNVPLLVSLFTDATAQSTREMLEIFKENRETTLCLGTLFRSPNAKLFSTADMAIGMDLLPGSQSSASLPPKHTGQLDQADLQFVRSLVGLSCALMLGTPATTEGGISEEYPVTLLLDLVREGRKLLQNMYQALIFSGVSYITLALLEVFSSLLPFVVQPSLDGAELVFLGLIYIPGLAFSLLASPADKDIMARTPEKNKDSSNFQGRHYWYIFLGTCPPAFASMVTFVWSFVSLTLLKEKQLAQQCCGSEDFSLACLNKLLVCEELFQDDSQSKLTNIINISQILMMTHLLLFFCMLSGLVTSYTTPCFLSNLHRNWLWICVVICVLCLQVAYSAFDMFLFSFSMTEVQKVHYGTFVFVVLSLLSAAVIIECIKRHNSYIHKRYLMFLRLEFETRLGMHSPK